MTMAHKLRTFADLPTESQHEALRIIKCMWRLKQLLRDALGQDFSDCPILFEGYGVMIWGFWEIFVPYPPGDARIPLTFTIHARNLDDPSYVHWLFTNIVTRYTDFIYCNSTFEENIS